MFAKLTAKRALAAAPAAMVSGALALLAAFFAYLLALHFFGGWMREGLTTSAPDASGASVAVAPIDVSGASVADAPIDASGASVAPEEMDASGASVAPAETDASGALVAPLDSSMDASSNPVAASSSDESPFVAPSTYSSGTTNSSQSVLNAMDILSKLAPKPAAGITLQPDASGASPLPVQKE